MASHSRLAGCFNLMLHCTLIYGHTFQTIDTYRYVHTRRSEPWHSSRILLNLISGFSLLETYSTENYLWERSAQFRAKSYNWAHFRNMAKRRLLASSRRSVRMTQLGSHWADLHETWYLRIGWKCKCKTVAKIQDIKRHVSILWCETLSLQTDCII
jgi:hypothetical protein